MKNSQSGFSSVVMTIIVAVVVVGGSLYFLDRYTELSIFSRKDGPGLPPTANWQTYRNSSGSITFRYPISWQVRDDSYVRDGQMYPLFQITSPDRLDMPGYQGVKVHYLIQVAVNLSNSTPISSVADFAKAKVSGDQSPWNTTISKQVTQSTDEYKLGIEILSTFKFTK